MNQELEIKRVPFMGTELMAARDADGQIWAGVRWMCDGIGLSKGQMQRERIRIQEDKVLSKGERNLVLPTNGGSQECLCLKLDFVPLWLAKISITAAMEQETPDVAAALEVYQLRAKDALAAAFFSVPGWSAPKKLFRLPEGVTLGSLVNFMRLAERNILDRGGSPEDVRVMIQETCEAVNFPVPSPLAKQIPGQLCIF